MAVVTPQDLPHIYITIYIYVYVYIYIILCTHTHTHTSPMVAGHDLYAAGNSAGLQNRVIANGPTELVFFPFYVIFLYVEYHLLNHPFCLRSTCINFHEFPSTFACLSHFPHLLYESYLLRPRSVFKGCRRSHFGIQWYNDLLHTHTRHHYYLFQIAKK